MKKILLIAVVVLAVIIFWFLRSPEQASGQLDEFAKCIAANDITMYGADWCPHCQNEKKAFGSSFGYIPYVECPDNPKQCIDMGITEYPTWIFWDGRKFESEMGINKLSRESGCPLPENK